MKNYFGYSFWLAIITTILLVAVSFVSPVPEGLRRINILSQVVEDSLLDELKNIEQTESPQPSPLKAKPKRKPKAEIDTAAKIAETIEVGKVAEPQTQTQPQAEPVADTTVKSPAAQAEAPRPQPTNGSRQQIEDFSSNGNMLAALKSKLASGKPVRIAVLGDSFIEGDIFTQDLRAQLQAAYGGAGVGYVPITSQVAGFRQSVGHTFSGWNTRSVLNNTSGRDFLLSGYTFTPSEGASVTYKGSHSRNNLSTFSRARLLFINKGVGTITATVNGTKVQTFEPVSSTALQQIVVTDTINSIKFSVSRVGGFMAYGAVLDGTSGVSVDNYSVRSYSGAGLLSLDANLCAQMDALLHYDLIILQYGLNVASPENTNYAKFASQMQNIIAHLKRVLPSSAVLVMSVSDRQSRTAGQWRTMRGIEAMEHAQRQMAQSCGVAYWSTLHSMHSLGGMNVFVQKGWAAKDYTHLSQSGGRKVATEFVQALLK